MAARESLLNKVERMRSHPTYGESKVTQFSTHLLTVVAESDLDEYDKYNLANLIDCYTYNRPTRDYYWDQVRERRARFSK